MPLGGGGRQRNKWREPAGLRWRGIEMGEDRVRVRGRPEQREIEMGRRQGETKIETLPDVGSRSEMGEQNSLELGPRLLRPASYPVTKGVLSHPCSGS